MIINHPEDVEIVQGHHVILEVKAGGTEPLYYQWHYEDNILHGILKSYSYCVATFYLLLHFAGENKPYCGIFPATVRNTGRYYCQVKNHYGIVNSSIATLVVTTSSKARKPPAATGFCYAPASLIIKKSTSKEGPVMLQTQDPEG